MKLVAAALAVSAALAAPGAAATTPRAIDVSGTYDSNWGPIELRQSGREVFGRYNFHQGHLHGTLDGNLIHYQWKEDADGSAGIGVFVVATNGQLIGTWGTSDDVSGGGWKLTPAGAAIAQP